MIIFRYAIYRNFTFRQVEINKNNVFFQNIFHTDKAVATYEPLEHNPLTDDKIDLFCDIQNIPPGVNVRWEKDGQPFDIPSTRIQFLDNNQRIQFSSVFPEDKGSYTCILDDGSGQSYMTKINPFATGKTTVSTLSIIEYRHTYNASLVGK